MSRVKFRDITAGDFFDIVCRESGKNLRELSDYCKVHCKTLLCWRSGRYLMPDSAFLRLLEIAGIKSLRVIILSDYWHLQDSARKGVEIARNFYGNPGTPEGRSLGGRRTIEKFSANPVLARRLGFVLQKEIAHPHHSAKLAEFIGVLLGDGGMTKYQVTITVHRKDDREYAAYIYNLVQTLFKLQPSMRHRESVTNIVISRVGLVNFLKDQGLQQGDKVQNQVGIPIWIQKNEEFRKACARGLYDTDGCFYIDRHRYKQKTYLHCAMNFTNRSLPILNFFKKNLEALGLCPTQKTKYSVFLRREQDIIRYMAEIGMSNLKHKQKYESFFRQKYGEVPKWS